ncbi:MAG: hypothetical protein NT145_05510 [Elusimicrobia bacterium]|nr:hypothetical protein [Elusimicrobiota bacterium]
MSLLVRSALAKNIPILSHWIRKVAGQPGCMEDNTSPGLATLATSKKDSQESVKNFASLGAKEQERALGRKLNMNSKSIRYDLVSNAKGSLSHAVEHLTSSNEVKDSDLKLAIRDVFHVIELLLKEKLRRIHPAFVLEDIDKYPSLEANTVGVVKAIKRLGKIGNIYFDENSNDTVYRCKKIRDSIEHYEFQIEVKEAKAIIGRMLSFIFGFSKKHLDIDLEEEFRADDRWSELLNIYEFWEAHSKEIENQLIANKTHRCICPSCGANTFVIDDSKCAICCHCEQMIKCDHCGEYVFESEVQEFNDVDYDEGGPISCVTIKICNNCVKENEDYEPDFDDIGD